MASPEEECDPRRFVASSANSANSYLNRFLAGMAASPSNIPSQAGASANLPSPGVASDVNLPSAGVDASSGFAASLGASSGHAASAGSNNVEAAGQPSENYQHSWYPSYSGPYQYSAEWTGMTTPTSHVMEDFLAGLSSRTRADSMGSDRSSGGAFGGFPGDADFGRAMSESGQEMYSEALGNWTGFMGPTYNPFGSAGVFQPADLDAGNKLERTLSNASSSNADRKDDVRTQTPSPPPASGPAYQQKKPSYCDVAKNHMSTGGPQRETSSKKYQLNKENILEGFPSAPPPGGHRPHGKSHGKSHTGSRSSQMPRTAKSLDGDAGTSATDLKAQYGLDGFEANGGQKERCKRQNSSGSDSVPLSRKGSSSSIGSGSVCSLDEISRAHIDLTRTQSDHRDRSGGYGVDETSLTNKSKFHSGSRSSPNLPSKVNKEKPRTANKEGSPSNGGQPKQNKTNERLFFDPKRIFQSKSTRSTRESGNDVLGQGMAQGIPTFNVFDYPIPPDHSGPRMPVPVELTEKLKEEPFFDPRRIFQQKKAELRTPVPNNQHDKDSDVLNNGKIGASLPSGGPAKPTATSYIQNDLRHKKHTNTDGKAPSIDRPIFTTPTTSNKASQGSGAGSGSRSRSSTSESASGQSGGRSARSTPAPEKTPSNHNSSNNQPSTSKTGNKPETTPSHPSSSRTDRIASERQPVQQKAGRRRKDNSSRPSRPEPKQPKKVKRPKEEPQVPSPLGELVIRVAIWCRWAAEQLGLLLWNVALLLLKCTILIAWLLLSYGIDVTCAVYTYGRHHVLRLLGRKGAGEDGEPGQKRSKPSGLKENITLPTTGEEAMRRLHSCKGKDPYSILGLRLDASDDDVKKYYRRQAMLVHPDKNQQPGAEEAFKILGHAFELIGETENRSKYDAQRSEATEAEAAMHEFADLLSKLHEKLQEEANTMRCYNCGGNHKRTFKDRPAYSARYCDRCTTLHAAKEGDVWAESSMLGFLWHYYACMEGKVYDITEWASCQSNHFKHIQANSHQVIYRIATNANKKGQQPREPDLEEFINHLFHHPGQAGTPGTSPGPAPSPHDTNQSFFNPGAPSTSNAYSNASPAPPAQGQAAAAAAQANLSKKKRGKKKRR